MKPSFLEEKSPIKLPQTPLRGIAKTSLLLFTLLLATETIYAIDFDPRQLIPGMSGAIRREAIENARRQKEETQQRGCEKIKSWFDAGPLPIPAGSPPRNQDQMQKTIMVLIEDNRFSDAFSKTYDQMTHEELRALSQEVLPRCFNRSTGSMVGYENMRAIALTILNPYQQQNNLRQLSEARNHTAELTQLTAELGTLQPNEESYSRLQSIRNTGEKTAAKASRQQADAFAKALEEAHQRVAAPIEAEKVKASVASASGYEGLVQLSKLFNELQKRNTQTAETRENLKSLTIKMNQIGTELAAIEHGRIDALGNGLVGLERGVQWQNEYNQRYKPYAFQVKPLNDLQTYFNERRTSILTASSNEFGRTIRSMRSEEQMNTALQRYLLDADKATVPGTQMLTAVAEQRREIEKRQVLGASLDEERREIAANNTGKKSASQPSQQSNSETVKGEPSQEEMYDLVRSRYEAEAERIRNLSKRCSSSRMADPTDAVVCLSIGIAGGVGADQPLKITRFEKLGCALASGKPGYYCEFEHSVSGGPSKFLGPITQSLAGEGGVSNARFLRRKNGWTMVYRTE